MAGEFLSINPATEEVVGRYSIHTDSEVENRIRQAEQAFRAWRMSDFGRRESVLRQLAENLRSRRDELARLMTLEMGKPITAAEAEIEKCAAACDYFADNGARMLGPQFIPTDATRSYVRFDPLGVVLAIMPWNFPFWQLFRFAAPAVMAGNAVVLKHAPNVCGCAAAIEEVFKATDAPFGLLTQVRVENERAQRLVEHEAICAVTLTGSGRAGRAVAESAGRVLKKCVLELGGSDPFIVLGDADVNSAAAMAASARCVNSGQSCIAAKRFIVERPIAEQFEKAFAAALSALKVGNPLDRATAVGPMARADLRENLHRQVTDSIRQGGRLVCGGGPIDGPGYYYKVSLLADVRPGMAAFDEETFGPVAALTIVENPDQAVEIANLTPFGLGGSVWSENHQLAEEVALRLDCGAAFVNGMVKSDARLPFGGVKASGYGRELSDHGIREFTNIKSVWIKEARSKGR